jgi:hypothetical protein
VLHGTTLGLVSRAMLSPAPWLAFALSAYATHAGDIPVGSLDGGVDSTLALGGLALCGMGAPVARLDLRLCLGAKVGAAFHRGQGFTRSLRSTEAWYAAELGLIAAAWLGRSVAIGVTAEALVPLRQHVLLVSGVRGAEDQTTELPGFGVGLAIGPMFRFF